MSISFLFIFKYSEYFMLLFTQHLNTCCSDAYESDSGVSSPSFAKQNFV